MSFVEKHKAWLLPLLGLGVGAVGYLNFRSSAPTPAPASPVEPAPLIRTSAVPAQVAPGPGDVWGDLQAMAKPQGPPAREAKLRERCRQDLGPLLQAPARPELLRPGRVREAEAEHAAAVAAPPPKVVEPPPVPTVDFVMSGPAGARAWIQGRPYRIGEAIGPGPYAVAAIERNQVTLVGPGGKTFPQVMNHYLPTHAGPRLPAEAP